MKRALVLLITAFLPVFALGQHFACRQDTVRLIIRDYRGDRQWQSSVNGFDWSRISDSQTDTLTLVAADPLFIRTELTEGQCIPVYSDIVQLLIHELPVVTVSLRDSACINEQAFILEGGNPAGGTFSGPGLQDGKFNPAVAGSGLHQIVYRYTDSLTGCSNAVAGQIRVSNLPNQASAGADQPFIAADSIRLDGNVPQNGSGAWTLLSGTGGRFSDPSDPASWFIRDSSNLDFSLRWTIKGECGSSSDDLNLHFFKISKNPCPGTPYVLDEDGTAYPTVQLGAQCWMAKNLNVGRYVASTVSMLDHSNLANNGITEKYCQDNDPANCDLYGGLYDWDEAMGYSDVEGARGICPEGWHLPTDQEWKDLNSFYPDGDAGTQLKVGGSSGFDALFAGDRHSKGAFYSFGSTGFFWESSSFIYQSINEGYLREVSACNGALVKTNFNKKTGISVRCLKNQ